MSKKIIAGALSVATVVSSFAVLGGMAFAADGWQQVTVTPLSDYVLGGLSNDTVLLEPSISSNDTGVAAALTIKATGAWTLDWQAVQGNLAAASKVAATGTNLGSTGFTNTGGYAMVGSLGAAGSANAWTVSLAAATGATLTGTPALTTSLSEVASGAATTTATVTPTYGASTDGTLGTSTYYGTIYYVLAASV